MFVIDASVAVKFVSAEPDSPAALAYVTAAEPLIAPDWVLVETASALFSKVGAKAIDRSAAEAGRVALPAFFHRLTPTTELLDDGFRLAFDCDHAVYDCLYLALAIRHEAMLVTADEKFWKATRRAGLANHVRLMSMKAGET